MQLRKKKSSPKLSVKVIITRTVTELECDTVRPFLTEETSSYNLKSLAQEVRQKSDISEHRSKDWG